MCNGSISSEQSLWNNIGTGCCFLGITYSIGLLLDAVHRCLIEPLLIVNASLNIVLIIMKKSYKNMIIHILIAFPLFFPYAPDITIIILNSFRNIIQQSFGIFPSEARICN